MGWDPSADFSFISNDKAEPGQIQAPGMDLLRRIANTDHPSSAHPGTWIDRSAQRQCLSPHASQAFGGFTYMERLGIARGEGVFKHSALRHQHEGLSIRERAAVLGEVC